MTNGDPKGADLAVKEVSFRYSPSEPAVFEQFSVRFPAGSRTVLLGRSGCGKSTLLALVGLLEQPQRGTVSWDGEDTDVWSDQQRSKVRNRHIGFVFQDHLLDPLLSASENVALPLRFAENQRSRAERSSVALASLTNVGLADFAHRSPSELSGGQGQRVAIARALVSTPRLLLVDEPTSALDSANSTAVLNLIDQVNAEHGTTIVISTHDETVIAHADTVIRLDRER